MRCADVYNLFFDPGEVVEIRAFGLSRLNPAWEGFASGEGIVYGYFDNAEVFGRAAEALEAQKPRAVYFTLNPVIEDLLARSANRLKASGKKSKTSADKDIKCIRWLPVDLDPIRPDSDISSTQEEFRASWELRNQISHGLHEMGAAGGIPAISGNGSHMLYRMPDLPNTEETEVLVKRCVNAIADRWTNDQVDIDRKVFNPARIWKLYGTTARKGDSTKHRPHRRAFIHDKWIEVPDEDRLRVKGDVSPCSEAFLQKLASEAVKEAPAAAGDSATNHKRRPEKAQPRRSGEADLGPVDVEKYLGHYGMPYRVKTDDKGTLYCLDSCLFDPNHKQEASIIQLHNGTLLYQCFHNSCRSFTWRDARQKISGDDKIVQFCEGYDPNYRSKKNRDSSPLDTELEETTPDVPPPHDVDPEWFFDGENGKNFRSKYLARYLDKLLSPIVWDGGDFYRYMDSGVWSTVHPDLIGKDADKAMGKYSTNQQIDSTTKLLAKRRMQKPQDLKPTTQHLNLQNGMLEIETGEMFPHDPKFLSRIQLPIYYDEEAKCPRWVQFLHDVFEDNLDKVGAMQAYFGYTLLQDCRFQQCLFLVGSGANGKSVACDTLIAILGEDNVCSLPLQLMGQRFLIGELKDKLVNVATEIATTQVIETSNFKDAVAGGLLTADRKHGDPYKFYPVAKHIFSMNEVPKIADKSHGFQRRPIVIKFEKRFEPGMKGFDPMLTSKLREERDGIFMWMLDGLKTVLSLGSLATPDSVLRDTEDLLKAMNPLLLYLEECCVVDEDCQVKPPALYRDYTKWCDEGNNRPLARNNFYSQVKLNCPSMASRRLGPDRQRVFQGIGLKAPVVGEEGLAPK